MFSSGELFADAENRDKKRRFPGHKKALHLKKLVYNIPVFGDLA